MYQRRLTGYSAIGYSIRGTAAGTVKGNRIFDQEDYLPVFAEDVRQTKRSILIVSPYLQTGQVKRFLSWLPQGIKVRVITGNENCFKPEPEQKVKSAIALLEEHGVQVQRALKQHQRCAVLDKQLL